MLWAEVGVAGLAGVYEALWGQQQWGQQGADSWQEGTQEGQGASSNGSSSSSSE
jgi:hypothetical protein